MTTDRQVRMFASDQGPDPGGQLTGLVLRRYRAGDAGGTYRVFEEAIARTASAWYTPAQLRAWNPGQVDLDQWDSRRAAAWTVVAEVDGDIAGFGDLTEGGVLDMLFVHPDHGSRGVARALVQAVLAEARRRGAVQVRTRASRSARPVLEHLGFVVDEEHADHTVRGQVVPCWSMHIVLPPSGRRPGRAAWRLIAVAVAGWVVANVWVAATAGDRLPFDWPARSGRGVDEHLLEVNLGLVEIFLLMGVVYAVTRRRADPQVAARAPHRALARRETALLLGYGALAMAGGFLLARALGWHPFGLHLAGTVYGTREHVSPAEALTWAGYNLLVYAVLPLVYFRRRYPAPALGLRSSDRRNDALVIVVVLVLEAAFQILAADPQIFALPPRQFVLGATLTFVLYLAGAVLPAMVFLYAILVPRYLALTGSATATVLLGGLTYAGLHLWDAWTILTEPGAAVLSLSFLLFTYLGPGMFKTYLTVRTGNAWVHVWAYHAFAPHTLLDTSHVVDVFRVH